MGTTDLLALPYPESSDPPNGAAQIQALAEAMDAKYALVGQIRMIANTNVPDGWLTCNGQAVSRTTYADLFAAIGISFGVGDGSTTFNVPDLRNRVPMGGGTIGAEGGADSDSITLTTGNLPAHSHSIAHNHPAATTSSNGAHDHLLNYSDSTGGAMANLPKGAGTKSSDNRQAIEGDGGHSHTFDVPNFTGNSGNVGSGSPFTVDTVPSHVRLNFIIFAGV